MIDAHQRMIGGMIDSGVLRDPWRASFEAVDRHLFIPDAVWRQTDDYRLSPVIRAQSPDEWMDLAYADEPVITQVDDGQDVSDAAARYPSSSASEPSVVARMLAAIDVPDAARVLEIGTGTGYNAALLAHRLGEQAVITIEVDAQVAADARKALARAGYAVQVVTADGTAGYPPAARYDRILSTAAVLAHLPYAWVAQTRPGGLIVTPWGTAFCNGALLHLTVAADGTATGRFDGPASFMRLRSQRTPTMYTDYPDAIRAEATDAITNLHPGHVLNDIDAQFAIGLRVPGCHVLTIDNDPDGPALDIWFLHPDTSSWAHMHFRQDADEHPVSQHGPRMLWNEIQAAHEWWVQQDEPAYTRFGLTVTPTEQWIWLDDLSQRVP